MLASATWTHTSPAGSCSAYWRSPTTPWAARTTHRTVSERRSAGPALWRRARSQTPTASSPSSVPLRPCQWYIVSSVSVPKPVKRGTISPVARLPGCGPAAVVSVPMNSTSAPNGTSTRVGEDDAPVGLRLRPRLVPRPPPQRDGHGEDRLRQEEVAHHEAGPQLEEHREAAEDALRQDAERQQHAQPPQVAPVRTAAEGEDEGGQARAGRRAR